MTKAFGMNVALLRRKTGLSQEQLADRLNVGKTTINNIETGYLTAPSLKLVEELAKVFNTTCDGILGTAPLEIGERARLVYIVNSICAKKPFVELDKVVDSVFIDRDKLRGYDWFGLSVNDNSMINRRIYRGDNIIVKKGAPVKNNDIVVASVGDSDEVIVRTYLRKKNIVTLKAENDSGMYETIEIDTDKESLNLIGKVVKCEFVL